MLNLPRKSFDSIKKYLLHRQKQVKEEIESIDKQDPVLMDGVAESSEPGTDSFQADVHARLLSAKNSLLEMSQWIKKSLINLRKGTYGKCERCGKKIEQARLEAMPTATLCILCSKKPGKS